MGPSNRGGGATEGGRVTSGARAPTLSGGSQAAGGGPQAVRGELARPPVEGKEALAGQVAPDVAAWMWLVFGYCIAVWVLASAWFVFRFVRRRHLLSLLIATMPLGWVMACALLLRIIPRWIAVPFVWTTALLGTVTLAVILNTLRLEFREGR
jgi:hypothetical protein